MFHRSFELDCIEKAIESGKFMVFDTNTTAYDTLEELKECEGSFYGDVVLGDIPSNIDEDELDDFIGERISLCFEDVNWEMHGYDPQGNCIDGEIYEAISDYVYDHLDL